MKNEEHKLELVRLTTGELYELTLLTTITKEDTEMKTHIYSLTIGEHTFQVSRLLAKAYMIQGSPGDKQVAISGKRVDHNELIQKMLEFRMELITYLLENGSSQLFAGIRDMQGVDKLVADTLAGGKV